MRECHVCETPMEENEITCPECGAAQGQEQPTKLKLSIKETSASKKVSNPMGTTISTGSGLTDILRGEEGEVDDSFYEDPTGFGGGTIPIHSSINVDDDFLSTKKKNHVAGTIFKILFLAAAAFGIYYMVVNVFLASDKAKTYKEGIDYLVEAYNDNSEDALANVLPPYISGVDFDKYMDVYFAGDYGEITGWKDVEHTAYSGTELHGIIDNIQLESGRVYDIIEGYNVQVQFSTNIDSVPTTISTEVILIKIKKNWYIYNIEYDYM